PARSVLSLISLPAAKEKLRGCGSGLLEGALLGLLRGLGGGLLDGLPAASGAGDQQQSAEGGEVLRELSLVGLRFAALHLPEGVPGQGGRDEGSGERPRRQSRLDAQQQGGAGKDLHAAVDAHEQLVVIGQTGNVVAQGVERRLGHRRLSGRILHGRVSAADEDRGGEHASCCLQQRWSKSHRVLLQSVGALSLTDAAPAPQEATMVPGLHACAAGFALVPSSGRLRNCPVAARTAMTTAETIHPEAPRKVTSAGSGVGASASMSSTSSMLVDPLSAAWATTAGQTEPVRRRSQPKRTPSITRPSSISPGPVMSGRLKLWPSRSSGACHRPQTAPTMSRAGQVPSGRRLVSSQPRHPNSSPMVTKTVATELITMSSRKRPTATVIGTESKPGSVAI